MTALSTVSERTILLASAVLALVGVRSPRAAGPVTTRYSVQAFPTFYVVDTYGRISRRSDGEQPNALLERELRKAARA
jgi:hypothetical protein